MIYVCNPLYMMQILHWLKNIPTGKVVTYKSLGKQFGIHPRIVARILASNTEQDIYPCYKVICSDGKLGGYNLWIDEKIRRLQADGISVKNNTVEKKYIMDYRW